MQRQNAEMIHIQHRQPAQSRRQHDGEPQRGDERSRLSRLAQGKQPLHIARTGQSTALKRPAQQ